jgi:hypothetical protein
MHPEHCSSSSYKSSAQFPSTTSDEDHPKQTTINKNQTKQHRLLLSAVNKIWKQRENYNRPNQPAA